MSKAKLFLTAAILAGSALATTGAHAAIFVPPNVFVGYSLDGGQTITTLASGTGSTGIFGATAGGFSISMSATGSPVMTNPNFDSNTITIASSSAGTITLYASETANTTIVPSFTIGFSNNPNSNVGVTEAFYSSNSSTAYAMTNLLASETVAPGITISDVAPAPGLTSPYSITEAFKITFTAAQQQVNATISERAAVPEPISLSVLGAGLASLGMVRLRRKS